MKLYLSQKHLCWPIAGIAIAVLAPPSNADTQQTGPFAFGLARPSVISDPALATQYVAMVRTQKLFKTPLDLGVQNATLEDIIEHIQKTLTARGKGKLPPVTIRGVNAVRLSFTAKNSTVGGVVNAAATLAGGRLWVLSDSALIVPDMAIPSEAGLPSSSLGERWSEQNAFSVLNNDEKRQFFPSFISREIDGPVATTEPIPPEKIARTNFVPWESLTSKTSFDQLSPDSQDFLQDLVADLKLIIRHQSRFKSLDPSSVPSFDLSPGAQIGISPNETGILVVNFAGGGTMRWGLHSRYLDWDVTPSKPTATLPLDLSAGKS